MEKAINIPAQLDAYIEESRALKFCWGTLDCCTFAAGWIRRLAGADLMKPYAYASARQAYRAMQAAGGLAEAVPRAFDAAGIAWRASPLQAPARGAVVLITTVRASRKGGGLPRGYSGWALGIAAGASFVLPGVQGLCFERLPSERVCAAWELLV